MELSIKDELCSDESSGTLKALLMRVHVSCSATVNLYESILVWKCFCVEVFLCGSIKLKPPFHQRNRHDLKVRDNNCVAL